MGNSARRIPNKPEAASEDENKKTIPSPRPRTIVGGGGTIRVRDRRGLEQTNF